VASAAPAGLAVRHPLRCAAVCQVRVGGSTSDGFPRDRETSGA
jgi:hypothetical protein